MLLTRYQCVSNMLHRRFDPLGLTSNILTNDVFAYKAVISTIVLALKGHINNAGTQFSSLLSRCFFTLFSVP